MSTDEKWDELTELRERNRNLEIHIKTLEAQIAENRPSGALSLLAERLGQERKRADRLARECAEWRALAKHLWSIVSEEVD